MEDNNNTTRSELDLYLEEKNLVVTTQLEIIKHWKQMSDRYPILSNMACDVLTIPITTVALESAFSIGAKVLTKYRNSFLPKNAQTIICARNWLCGYNITSDEVTDEQFVVPLIENQESNRFNVAYTTTPIMEI